VFVAAAAYVTALLWSRRPTVESMR
jgi:hypothetical protein